MKNNFYANNFLDSLLTLDSVHFKRIGNTIGWTNSKLVNEKITQKLFINTSLTHSLISAMMAGTDTKFGQLEFNTHARFGLSKKTEIFFASQLANNDYNGNSNHFKSGLRFFVDTNFIVEGNIWSGKSNPTFIETKLVSNHFIWDNSFAGPQNKGGGVLIRLKSSYLDIGYNSFKNYIYYDVVARPRQYEPAFDLFTAKLHNLHNFGRFTIENTFVWQKVFGPELIRIPEFIDRFTFSYNKSFFTEVLHTRFGIETQFVSSYFADAWMPATRQFYLQNNKKIENLVMADLFLNMKLKRALFFFKYQHFNAGLFGYDYYAVPGYPLQGRAFKFGVSWK
ncbi:MAG: putative porin, partial [Flavobacterium sp.]|nr:putative porin [Flavobacterium sp.]